MRWASSLLALAACNQVFGSTSVRGFDAQVFDAGIDARPTCTSGTPPSFERDFFQLDVDDCYSVTVAGTAMVGICGAPIAYGEIGSVLVPVPEFPMGARAPRLAHDGQRISMILQSTSNLRTVMVFHRSGTTWLRDPDIASSVDILGASQITNGPNARVLIAYSDGIHELVEQAGSWVDIATHMIAYASEDRTGLHVSGDALRGWYEDGPLKYFDRPDLDSQFAIRGTIGGTEGVEDTDLTDDCGLMYFGAIGRIWIGHPAPP